MQEISKSTYKKLYYPSDPSLPQLTIADGKSGRASAVDAAHTLDIRGNAASISSVRRIPEI